ncbi:helix-turn-helix domain-containing protein [Kiloniella sp.]|uniref:helix-turn-helix domain-containing protein n=1 Tax=Kiloniella sp. TaxID=1938587 RepID=UPI003B014FF6
MKKNPNPNGKIKGQPNAVDVYIGKQIRTARTFKGMSQGELGRLMGLTFQQIQKYEQGANRVSGARIVDLCRVLDEVPDYFLSDIPKEVMEQSPGYITFKENVEPINIEKPDFNRRETMELVKAYYNLPFHVRHSMLLTIKAAGKTQAEVA